MPDELPIIMFAFGGTAEVKAIPRRNPAAGSQSKDPGDGSPTTGSQSSTNKPQSQVDEEGATGSREEALAAFESEVVANLNEKSDEIASSIQREVGRLFRSFSPVPVNVQADVNFYEGTIVVEGTILLIAGWLGNVALQATERALVTELSRGATELSRAMGLAIQRVLRRALRNQAPEAQFEPFRVDVTPRVVNPGTQVHVRPSASPPGQPGMSGGMLAFLIADTLLLVAVLAVLLVILTQVLSAA